MPLHAVVDWVGAVIWQASWALAEFVVGVVLAVAVWVAARVLDRDQ